MAQDASAGESEAAGQPASRRLTFLDLPHETQKEIFSHCSQSDLICLSLVSRYFRELAAAPLYRNFHIVFPDEDDPAFDSPIDGLAGGLDTFVTSDYDYAKHLRDLSLDTLSAGDKAETAYKPYLYHVSCGKFMNTLLLLTLRKARSLESFRWNIRVELSRPVYRALHQIDTLNTLHIRLQAGPSLYETPPPLPFTHSPSTSTTPPPPTSTYLPDLIPPPGPPPPPPTFSIPPPQSIFYTPPTSLPPPPVPKSVIRTKVSKRSFTSKEPPTLSGFKNLKKLAVLDIDSLDIVTEIKSCVKNSSGTLTKLKLSFSDSLGLQSRKPAPEVDPDDSDPEDEFQAVPLPPNPSYMDEVSGPARAFRAQEERKSQETVLGRIFDVEPVVIKKPQRKAREKEKEPEESGLSPGRAFISAIKGVANKLMKDINGAGDLSSTQQEILDTIEAAARKYVASEDAKDDSSVEKKDEPSISSKEPTNSSGEPSSSSGEPSSRSEEPSSHSEVPSSGSEMPSSRPEETNESVTTTTEVGRNGRPKDDELKPEDISIEEPEEQLNVDSQETSTKDTPAGTPANEPDTAGDDPAASITPAETPSADPTAPVDGATTTAAIPQFQVDRAMATLAAQRSNLGMLAHELEEYQQRIVELQARLNQLKVEAGGTNTCQMADLQGEMRRLHQVIEDSQQRLPLLKAMVSAGEKHFQQASTVDEAEAQNRRVSEYVRSTRGLALQSLSIYLIPVKASVLSRAVDLRVLKRLTLLNVGAQAPIWALLAKENKAQPLPLRKIFTDNVSAVFLNFVSQLPELHELFMLERDPKYKPESFAPRSNTTIEQIRRLALRKHLPTLQKLIIKNQADSNWDIDEKTILLICRRGKVLEELAINMGIKTMHVFLQNLAGLVSLRALHVIQLRNDDTCVWVMRETKRFLIDNLSHHPELRLEWVSIDDEDRVERILRPSDLAERDGGDRDGKDGKDGAGKKKTDKAKGKQKATATTTTALGIGATLGVGSAGFATAASEVFPLLPQLDGLDAGSDSDEDDDDDGYGATGAGKVETIENIHFYDVWGVRIFKKEIVTGRL